MGNDLFGEIVKRAQLNDLRPVSFSVKRGAREGPSDEELNLESECTFRLSDDGSRLVVLYSYEVKQEGESGEAHNGFEATASYELLYSFQPELTEEHKQDLEVFAEHNGRFNSWPYLRSFLARATAELELPVLTLPLLKPFAPNPRRDDSADRSE